QDPREGRSHSTCAQGCQETGSARRLDPDAQKSGSPRPVERRCPGCSEFAANISRGAHPHLPNAQSIPGMAAGVTERLWETGDIVDVLEAWDESAWATWY